MVKRGYLVLGVSILLVAGSNFVLAESSLSDTSFNIVSINKTLEINGFNFNSGLYIIGILIVVGILFRIILREYKKRNKYKRAIKVRRR